MQSRECTLLTSTPQRQAWSKVLDSFDLASQFAELRSQNWHSRCWWENRCVHHGSKMWVERSHITAMEFSWGKQSYSAAVGACKFFVTFHKCLFANGKLQLQHTYRNYGATHSLMWRACALSLKTPYRGINHMKSFGQIARFEQFLWPYT